MNEKLLSKNVEFEIQFTWQHFKWKAFASESFASNINKKKSVFLGIHTLDTGYGVPTIECDIISFDVNQILCDFSLDNNEVSIFPIRSVPLVAIIFAYAFFIHSARSFFFFSLWTVVWWLLKCQNAMTLKLNSHYSSIVMANASIKNLLNKTKNVVTVYKDENFAFYFTHELWEHTYK